jgi:hypothetical protein
MRRGKLAAVLPGVLLVTGPLCFLVLLVAGVFAQLGDATLPARFGGAVEAAFPGLVRGMLQDGAAATGPAAPWMKQALEVRPALEDELRDAGLFGLLGSRLQATCRDLVGAARAGRGKVVLDLAGLDRAVASPQVEGFVARLLEGMPPCEEEQLDAWRELMLAEDLRGVVPPPCRPGDEVPADRLHWGLLRAVEAQGLSQGPRLEVQLGLPMPLVAMLVFPVLALVVMVLLLARGGMLRVLGSTLVVGGGLGLVWVLFAQRALRRVLGPALQDLLTGRLGGGGDGFYGMLSGGSLARGLGELGAQALGTLNGSLTWSAAICLVVGLLLLVPGMGRAGRED